MFTTIEPATEALPSETAAPFDAAPVDGPVRLPDRTLPLLVLESPREKWTGLAVALIVAGLYAFTVLSFWAPADGGIDQNAYLVGGRMIANHFTTRFDPANPFAYIGHMFDQSAAGHFYPKYPFGLPLLYALVLTVFHSHPEMGMRAAFLVSPVCAVMAVSGTFLLARRIAGSFVAVLAMIMLATSQVMLELANNANSHASCTAFAVWGFFILLCWWQTEGGKRRTVLGILGGFLVGYAGLIRYSEGLLVLAVAVACACRLRWTDWRSYLRCAIPGLAWAVPIATLLIYNKLTLGDWTGYDSTNESVPGSAFTWLKFTQTWEEMLRTIHDMGLFFILPLGVAGLAMLFRRNWQVGLMMVMWAFPGIALYTSYYWSPERGLSYARFFLTFFPAFVIGAAVCFKDGILGTQKPGEHWARTIPVNIAVGLVVAIASGVGVYRSVNGMESGGRGQTEDLLGQYRSKLNLSVTGQTLFRKVPEHSMLFTETGGMGNSPINYLQFIQNWDLFALDGFSPTGGRRGMGGGGGGGGGFGGGPNGGGGGNGVNTPDTPTPSPMQPRLRQYFTDLFNNKSNIDLIHEEQKAVDATLGDHRRVFIAASGARVGALKTSLLGEVNPAKPRYTFALITQWRDYVAPDSETPTTTANNFGGGRRRGGLGGGFGGPGGGGPGFGGAPGGLFGGAQPINWQLVEVTATK